MSLQDDAVSDEELELKVFPEDNSLENNERYDLYWDFNI